MLLTQRDQYGAYDYDSLSAPRGSNFKLSMRFETRFPFLHDMMYKNMYSQCPWDKQALQKAAQLVSLKDPNLCIAYPNILH